MVDTRWWLPRTAALILFAAALLSAAPARADEAPASVVVVHGVPGLTVDVYVNGTLTLPGFEPGTVTDPIPLPAGSYALAIVPAGGELSDAVLAATATLAAADDVSIVAHLEADGDPKLTIFANDLSRGGAGEGRVVVRHVAAAPAVDVRLDRRWFRWHRTVGVLRDLANGDEEGADVRAGRYLATISPAGSRSPVAPGARVRVKRDQATIVYAVGSLSAGTFQLLEQRLELTGTTAAVSVVHAVVGLEVDVYVNGDLLLPNFQPGTITDPLALPPGTYEVAIVAAGGDPASPAISGEATVAAGDNVSLVAQLDATGNPVLRSYANDTRRLGAYRSRLVARHAAAAGEVDVLLERCVGWRYLWWHRLRGLENGEQKGKALLPGLYRASLTPPGHPSTRLLGPAPLWAAPRNLYAVYAIGSAQDGSLGFLVQTLPLR